MNAWSRVKYLRVKYLIAAPLVLLTLLEGWLCAQVPNLTSPSKNGRIGSDETDQQDDNDLGRFGEPWTLRGCDGKFKRHAGVDIVDAVGAPVLAAYSGTVLAVGPATRVPGSGFVTMLHTAPDGRRFTTTYWHVVPKVRLGQKLSVPKYDPNAQAFGPTIATVEGLAGNPHFHFGVRDAPFGVISSYLSLPDSKNCGLLHPKFPEKFVDPEDCVPDLE